MFMKLPFSIFRKEHKGFTLIESVMALTLFLIVGTVIFVTLNGILEIIREGIATVESKLNVQRLAFRLRKEVAPLTVIDRVESKPGKKFKETTFIFWNIYANESRKPLASFTKEPTDVKDRLMVAKRLSYRLVSNDNVGSQEKDTGGTILERREELYHWHDKFSYHEDKEPALEGYDDFNSNQYVRFGRNFKYAESYEDLSLWVSQDDETYGQPIYQGLGVPDDNCFPQDFDNSRDMIYDSGWKKYKLAPAKIDVFNVQPITFITGTRVDLTDPSLGTLPDSVVRRRWLFKLASMIELTIKYHTFYEELQAEESDKELVPRSVRVIIPINNFSMNNIDFGKKEADDEESLID